MNRTTFLTLAFTLACTALPAVAEEPAAAPASAPAAEQTDSTPSVTPASESAPATQGTVQRAIITTAIKDHEPVDDVSSVGSETLKVYLFTDLRGMKGEHITHRWMYNGQVVSDVGFDVKGDRWRVWSSKTLQPIFAGKWTVKVLDAAGNELTSKEFDYTAK